MRELCLLLMLMSALVAFSGDLRLRHHPSAATNAIAKDSVYICDSKTAYAYHKTEYCSGLNRCTHGVYKV